MSHCPKCNEIGKIVGKQYEDGYGYGCTVAYVYSCGKHNYIPLSGNKLVDYHEFQSSESTIKVNPAFIVVSDSDNQNPSIGQTLYLSDLGR